VHANFAIPCVGFSGSGAPSQERPHNTAWRQDVSRRRSVDTLRGYVRDAEIFKDHAGAGLL
jgi:hypothetical protein